MVIHYTLYLGLCDRFRVVSVFHVSPCPLYNFKNRSIFSLSPLIYLFEKV